MILAGWVAYTSSILPEKLTTFKNFKIQVKKLTNAYIS